MTDLHSMSGTDLSDHIDEQRVIRPGSARFDEAIRLWNGAVNHRPRIVVRPTSIAEVQSVVRYARANELTVSVRGGGHDWAGRALVSDGVVVDMSSMRDVSVDADSQVASLAGGATASDVAKAAGRHGLAPATGQFGGVGMVGLTLAGGYGPLLGTAGLALDNVLELQMVLEDGRAVDASADREPELFWAARGGGGNFGIVTQMRVRLHRASALTAGVIAFPWAQASDVLRKYAALIAGAPDQLTVAINAATGADGNLWLYLWPTWFGSPDDSSRWITQLIALGRPTLTHVAPMSYVEALAMLDPYDVWGRHYEMRTRNLPTLSLAAIDTLILGGAARTNLLSGFAIHHFHGAATRVPLEHTAFGVRTPHFMVEVLAAWNPGEDAISQRNWAEAFSAALKPHALDGGYPNLIGPGQRDQANESYGPNVDRLLVLKRRYDPAGVFSATPLPERNEWAKGPW
jgi:FAD/FMN-containing dehydrogenase